MKGATPALMQFADANAAAAHLLRHLHNPRKLRQNPLVAHIFVEQERAGEPPFVALERVHAMVIATAERIFGGEQGAGRALIHKRRQLEIIIRCDIRGELHKSVQTEMGLGARQFYRERLRARRQMAKALESLIPAGTSDGRPVFDAYGLAITSIRAARNRGDDALAMELIRNELVNTSQPIERFELLVSLAAILSDIGDFNNSRDVLRDAAALGLSDPYSQARLLQSQAELASIEGRFMDSARLCDAALLLYSKLVLPRRIEHEEQLAATLLLASLTKYNIGLYDQSLLALQDARDIVERRPELPLLLKVRVLKHLAAAHMALPASQETVERYLLEARALSQRNGLIREAVECTLYLSRLHDTKGDAEHALVTGRETLRMVEGINGRAVYAWFCITVAYRELSQGLHDNALHLIRGARICNCAPAFQWVADLAEAQVLLCSDAFEKAFMLARSTVDAFRQIEHWNYAGVALRVAAQAAYSLGKVDYARAAIGESTLLLERYGSPESLRAALSLFERINAVDSANMN